MKNFKKTFALIILFSVILVFSIFPVTAAAISVPHVYTITDEGIEIDVKYKKAATNKITFNANGGKIGSKKTVDMNIKKGSKIKKFPGIPKRTGYTFHGWFTKKKGGKEITKNAKPGKSLTYFAQWKKVSVSSKLVGHWQREDGLRWGSNFDYFDISKTHYAWYDYYFFSNGRFQYYCTEYGIMHKIEGKYSVSNGKIYFKERKWYKFGHNIPISEISNYGVNDPKNNYELIAPMPNMISEYMLEKDYLKIGYQRISYDMDPNYVYPHDGKYKGYKKV